MIKKPSTTKSKLLAPVLAAVTASGGLVATGAASADTTASAPEDNPVVQYAKNHPLDYVGMSRIAREIAGEPMQFSVNGIDQPVSAQKAEEITERRHQKRLQLKKSARDGAQVMDVPINAFTVTSSLAPAGHPRDIFPIGTWDFRDNYVNGSAPDDIASLQVPLGSCLNLHHATITTKDYQGTEYPHAAYIRDAGIDGNAVAGIRDNPTPDGFALNNDNGVMAATVTKNANCGPTRVDTQFIYEHNQDGGNVVSVNVGWGFLGINYGGGPSALQKSARAPHAVIP
ncbi:hypothetical protein [Salinifilum ghardaiensis]